MKRDNSIYCLKRAKLIQLILTICMDLVFFILFLQKSFQAAISASPSLIYLCAAVWISIVSFLLFLLWDLTLLRSLSAKSRELNRLVYLDALTSIPNRHCLDGFLTDHISSHAWLLHAFHFQSGHDQYLPGTHSRRQCFAGFFGNTGKSRKALWVCWQK